MTHSILPTAWFPRMMVGQFNFFKCLYLFSVTDTSLLIAWKLYHKLILYYKIYRAVLVLDFYFFIRCIIFQSHFYSAILVSLILPLLICTMCYFHLLSCDAFVHQHIVTKHKKHGNAMKPGFQVTIALYLLKFLALGSWCDECIMIYFKTSSFS